MRLLNILKTIRQEIRNFVGDTKAKSPVSLSEEENKILQEIRTKGFCIIPNFYSGKECADTRQEIDKLLEKYDAQIFKDEKDSDHRIHGADRLSPIIEKFFKNPTVDRLVRAHEKTDNIVGFTLAARLEYKPNNLGSGGGWHRDWAVNKQIKAILYLSDVDEQKGPFQFLEGSQRHSNIVKDSFLNNFEFNQNRFTDAEVETMIKRDPAKLRTFTGKAGTLLLVNTRGIHRGMPILNGTRYALTNYYWSNMPIPSHLEKMIIVKQKSS
jgi:hypothetical protein